MLTRATWAAVDSTVHVVFALKQTETVDANCLDQTLSRGFVRNDNCMCSSHYEM